MKIAKNLVVIRAIAVRAAESWDYIPIQIRVTRYEDGLEVETLDTMIRPTKDVKGCPDLPVYLPPYVLEYAPTPHSVALQVEELSKGCEVDMDAVSTMFLKGCMKKKGVIS